MNAIIASTESFVDRHQRLWHDLRAGNIRDLESRLFLQLLQDLPDELAATPYLHDVSWCGGRCDLLFTDGARRWCAVEVKNFKGGEEGRKRRKKLAQQTRTAFQICCLRLPSDRVRAVGLWLVSDVWITLESVPERGAEET